MTPYPQVFLLQISPFILCLPFILVFKSKNCSKFKTKFVLLLYLLPGQYHLIINFLLPAHIFPLNLRWTYVPPYISTWKPHRQLTVFSLREECHHMHLVKLESQPWLLPLLIPQIWPRTSFPFLYIPHTPWKKPFFPTSTFTMLVQDIREVSLH